MTNTGGLRQLKPGTLLFILTGLNLFNYLDRLVLSAVLPLLQKDLNLNDSQGGTLGTVFMMGYFLTSPLFGWLGDRFSRKWLIAGGIFIWSLGTVLTGFAPTFVSMVLFRVLVGVGEASYATISPSLISDSYGPEKRNNALTIFYVAIPVGGALGMILGGVIADVWGWRHAFIWAGAPGLLLALSLLPFAEPKRGGADAGNNVAPQKPTTKDMLKLFRIPDYVLVVLGYAAQTFALGGFALWAPAFLNRVHEVPVKDAATFFGLVLAAAGLVGTMLGGFAATAWQKRNRAGYAWTLGLSAAVSAPLAFGAFLVHDRWLSMALLAAAVFFVFMPTGPINTLILESVPINLRVSAMAGSIFTIHLLGDMWSPAIVGRVADATGSLRDGVLILPAALIVGAILWLSLALKTKRSVAVEMKTS